MFNVIRRPVAPASLATRRSYSEPDVVKALKEDFFDKCYICETKDPMSLNVEHFDAHQGSEEKKYEWRNLFYACARCNNFKRHHYNDLLDCTSEDTDVLRLIRHAPPITPWSPNVVIEAKSDDPKTVSTTNLIFRIFNESDTGNKVVTSTYLRKRVYKRYAKFLEYINIFIDDDSIREEKDVALAHLKNLMDKGQEYSAFLRWAVLDSPELLELLGDSIN
ncbi:hypothetical protein [Pseudomonas sp. IAC-BECa141]|uniref:hypothetical protein n=1 Tax=Pseudomonas sp. IAC-BECa141 TaxID=2793103 RepID=UPI001D069CD9|nr:hypothetical protein [Pseudomonas sp. IAC-BECa141]UDI90601.1 hypothetical protein I5961_15620 [Pseudomonas sp. IAC-BECa141]